MSIRRKQRQRGKRKELRREALKTWDRLVQTDKPNVPSMGFPGFPGVSSSVIVPMVRRVMPGLIANELVGVQPMSMPAEGSEFTVRYSYGNRTKKEISEQRKKERKDKKYANRVIKRAKAGVDEVSWGDIDFSIRDDLA